MTRSIRRLLLGALLASTALVPSGDAQACSVCIAGDPYLDASGIMIQERNQISGSLQVRGWEKKNGLLPGAGPGSESIETQRVDLFLSYTPIDRLTLTLDVPWIFNELTQRTGGGSNTTRAGGIGDFSLAMNTILWRNRRLVPSTWIEGRALVKFPTGTSSQSIDGVKQPHIQIGTGSWDFAFGLAGVHRLKRVQLFSSASYRINTEGSLDYEYGDSFLANLAVMVPLGDAFEQDLLVPYTLGFEFNFRYAEQDEFQGMDYRDSGGSMLYATPSLRSRLPWSSEGKGPWLRGSVQIPTTSAWLRGFQKEDPIWSVALQASF